VSFKVLYQDIFLYFWNQYKILCLLIPMMNSKKRFYFTLKAKLTSFLMQIFQNQVFLSFFMDTYISSCHNLFEDDKKFIQNQLPLMEMEID
jgi:hypothetical protein